MSLDKVRIIEIENEFGVYRNLSAQLYGPQTPESVVRYRLAVSNLLLAVPVVLAEYKRVERERVELIRQLTDSFANDLVHVESGPPPEEPSARGWFEEYEKHLKDMLQWMKRIGGDE